MGLLPAFFFSERVHFTVMGCLRPDSRSAYLQPRHRAKRSVAGPPPAATPAHHQCLAKVRRHTVQVTPAPGLAVFCWKKGELPLWVLALDRVPVAGVCQPHSLMELLQPERQGRTRQGGSCHHFPFVSLPVLPCGGHRLGEGVTPPFWVSLCSQGVLEISAIFKLVITVILSWCCLIFLVKRYFFTYIYWYSFLLIAGKGLVTTKQEVTPFRVSSLKLS